MCSRALTSAPVTATASADIFPDKDKDDVSKDGCSDGDDEDDDDDEEEEEIGEEEEGEEDDDDFAKDESNDGT